MYLTCFGSQKCNIREDQSTAHRVSTSFYSGVETLWAMLWIQLRKESVPGGAKEEEETRRGGQRDVKRPEQRNHTGSPREGQANTLTLS